jgi:uncharacterized protein (TIGR04255 family)
MENRVPAKLKREPLIEALWEVRFTGGESSVVDLLPGLIFKALPDKYPKTLRLPSSFIPDPVAQMDPKLRYSPKVRLEGDCQAVQIGERVVSLSCRRPYPGWKVFSDDIRILIGVIRETKLIDKLERFSLKYINIIDLEHPPRVECLNFELKIGEYGLDSRPIQLRTEIEEGGLVHILQIASPAEATLPGEPKLQGVLLDIDTIGPMKQNESWDDIDNHLNKVHSALIGMFFGLLKPKTIENLGPVYEE